MNKKYINLLKELMHTDVKDTRKIKGLHKELKKYGDGVPFYDRYEISDIPIIASTISSVITSLIVLRLLVL